MHKEWIKIQSILENSLAPGQGKVWLAPLLPAMDEDCFILHARNEFIADFVRRRFLPQLEQAARSVFDCPCRVDVRVQSKHCASVPAAPIIPEQLPCGVPQAFQEEAAFAGLSPKATTLPAVGPASLSEYVSSLAPAPEGGALQQAGTAASEMPVHLVAQNARPAPRPLPSKQLHLPMPAPESCGAGPLGRSWRFSFDDFIVGPCNELAYAASRSMCAERACADVLYLASPPGLGKTHLLQAAGRMLTEHCTRRVPKVEYLTAEEFASRLWLAIKGSDTDRFKARYREADLLLLEDVHFLQGKEAMQAELLATLKALTDRGSKVIFTSSFSPKDLQKMDDQLLSRLSAGLFSHIDRPDEETRRRILRSKASLHQVLLPEDVEDALARHINADVRQIESCLRNLILKAQIYNRSINMQMAWEIIGNYISHTPSLSLTAIIDQICKSFGLSQEQLFSNRRKQDLVYARNTAFYLARKHTDLSLEAIGQHFNRRHSTVIKGITSLEREISRQSPLGRQIASTVALIERNNSAPL